jgi:hypothetical protein
MLIHARRTLLVLIGATTWLGCRPRPNPAPVTPVAYRPAEPQHRRFASGQPPTPSTRVNAGTLEGLVVDEESGKPIDMAQIVFPRATVRVFSDSTGRFRVTIPREPGALMIFRIGFEQTRFDTLLDADSGYVMVAALRRAAVVLCRVVSGVSMVEVHRDSAGRSTIRPIHTSVPNAAVIVSARDALSGTALMTPLTVIAVDGAYRDSLTTRVDTSGRAVGPIAADRPGNYAVTLRSPGYRDWQGTASTHAVAGCPGEFAPAVFRAWMVPR